MEKRDHSRLNIARNLSLNINIEPKISSTENSVTIEVWLMLIVHLTIQIP